MKKGIALAAGLLAAAGLHAAATHDFAGTWALRLGPRNLFVLSLSEQNGALHGSFSHPWKFASTNSLFANISGDVRHDPVITTSISNGALHLTVQNASDPKDQDTYVMTVSGDHAELRPSDLPPGVAVAPWVFERVSPEAKVATDWEPNRLYTGDDSDVSSTAMAAIFEADQKDRTAATVDWTMVSKADALRREQTRKLLSSGALHTGKDYERAAFVFQHGESADDYLLAHTLSMVAVTKGEPTAIWIATATLDRYLQTIGRRQVFGTQFRADPKLKFTQEPYDRALISDSLRRQLGVPSMEQQADQLRAYQQQK